jgi:hypothetical protein
MSIGMLFERVDGKYVEVGLTWLECALYIQE